MKWLGKYNLNYSGEYISLSTNKTLPIDHLILSCYGEEPAPPGLRSLSCGVWLVMDVLYVEAGVSAGWWWGGGSTKTVHCRHEAVLRTASPGHVTLTTTHHHQHHHTHTTRNTNPTLNPGQVHHLHLQSLADQSHMTERGPPPVDLAIDWQWWLEVYIVYNHVMYSSREKGMELSGLWKIWLGIRVMRSRGLAGIWS